MKNRICVTAILLALILMPALPRVSFAEDDDATLRFYVENVAYVFARNYLFNTEADFSFKARTILRTTDYRGVLKKIDTGSYAVYYKGGRLHSVDSLDSVAAGEVPLPDSFLFREPWKTDYSYYFFPNDTGAGRLAIGFELEGAGRDSLPNGFFNINRDDFYPQALFLHSRNVGGYKRLSNTYYFKRLGKILLPERFEKFAVQTAFLGRRYTRYIVEFYDYLIE
ncbi:MAG: hypothetical protein JSU69_07680 [Candidatus Zixiibacteriota bacterium]|nr:MAG: hypothetical protein JSU69_07680 [candidate division Zixibacteria bacterium]